MQQTHINALGEQEVDAVLQKTILSFEAEYTTQDTKNFYQGKRRKNAKTAKYHQNEEHPPKPWEHHASEKSIRSRHRLWYRVLLMPTS